MLVKFKKISGKYNQDPIRDPKSCTVIDAQTKKPIALGKILEINLKRYVGVEVMFKVRFKLEQGLSLENKQYLVGTPARTPYILPGVYTVNFLSDKNGENIMSSSNGQLLELDSNSFKTT